MTQEGEKKIACIEKEGGYVSTPMGDSMRPMLRGKRDSVLVKAVEHPIKKGDVLLYETENGQHVLHRVVRIKEGGYEMRGDNCFAKEPLLTGDRIIGILSGFWRDGRYFSCREHKGYRFYAWLWTWSFPLRRFLRRVKNGLKRLFGKSHK